MLENRSFDHLLGFSGLPGVPRPPARFGFQPGSPDQSATDPPHELDDVAAQIHGGAMNGFPASGGSDAMHGFTPGGVRNLIKLAKDNLLFDNWFSSMPGPTWPNRLFAHAASSGGLDNSLGSFDVFRAVTNPGYYLGFDQAHIFDRLSAKGLSWRIYHGDTYPQVLCLKGMVSKKHDLNFFRPSSRLADDLKKGDTVAYTFIEPNYQVFNNYKGDSQHPLGKISEGEKLIAYVYNAIFKQKVGDHSALLITWDEHGGFFDHVTPPASAAPGDSAVNYARAKTPRNCRFDRFGVRVPAFLISSWLPIGLGSSVFGPSAYFDHSSIVRALRSTFSLGAELTRRDRASPDWNQALLAQPRKLKAVLPAVPAPLFDPTPPDLEALSVQGPPSGNLLATSQIAVDLDWYVSERMRKPPLVASDFQLKLTRAQMTLSQVDDSARMIDDEEEAHRIVLEYLAAVRAREFEFETRIKASAKKRR